MALKTTISALVLVFQLIGFIKSATIGDGRTSLIDGRPADYRSGTCYIDGRTYASETSVPRDDPCHYCICYRGRVDCYWKKCANVPAGCHVMAIQGSCNPSLYVCDIPVKARHAPVYGFQSSASIAPARNLFVEYSQPTARTNAYDSPRTSPPTSTVQFSVRPARQPVIPPTRELTPPDRQYIEPPTRHLTPPVKQQSLERQLGGSRQPSQFSLRMKEKMRFRRSLENAFNSRLPFNIGEDFPMNFDEGMVLELVNHHIRSRRAINGSAGDNHHHHHHDHHHEEDRGCEILGVRYELGEVVGVATDVCQECRCAAQSLFCSPKCCFKPAPFQLAGDLNRILEYSSSDNQEGPKHPLYYVQSEFA